MKTTAREVVAARMTSASPLVLQITHKDGSSSAHNLRQQSSELTAGALAKAKALAGATATHGGPGRGGGRKPADGAVGLKRRNVSLDDASVDTLRAHGDGDVSLGIRRAAAEIRTRYAVAALGYTRRTI